MNKRKGSGDINITNNYYAPIGQHINHVDTVNLTVQGDGTMRFDHVEETNLNKENGTADTDHTAPIMSDELATPRAEALWEKAIDEGWVDERRQPLLSRPLAAMLADRMAQVLGIAAKWKVFEQLWRRKNMRNDYNTALNQQQYDEWRKKFERIIR